MLRRSLAFLLVALGLGVAWFYYERQDAGDQPQRFADAPPEATQPGGKGAETAPEPAPSEAGADATVEAPTEAEASPDNSAAASAETGLDATVGEAGRDESHGGEQTSSTETGQQVRLKGEAAGSAPAEPGAASGAVVKGQTSIPPSEDAAAAVTPDAQADEGTVEEPPSGIAAAEPPPTAPSEADTAAPASKAAERAEATPEPSAPQEHDEQALAALPGDQRRSQSDVPAPQAGAAEPPTTPGAAEAVDTREREKATEGEQVTGAREQETEETSAWWRWVSPDGWRQGLGAIFGGDEEEPAPQRPAEDTAVAKAPEEPKSARKEAETPETPSESLSAETIRRALAALVGGDEPPAPEAGPPEPAPEEEIVEPEPVKPTFDIVRINQDRTAIIAGRAEPDAKVEVVVGDRVVDRVSADRRGQWVSTPLEPLKPGDREMTVTASLGEGAQIESEQVVVVAVPAPPPPQPPAVAAAAPPPPQPAEVAAAEAPPPQPPASATTTSPEPTQTARAQAADAAVAVLMAKDGAGAGRILQAPGRISNDGKLALMIVDYDDEGKVRLSGEAPPGAPVRIYVDNRRAADVVSTASGEWQAVLEQELAPGTYTLRLDQLGAGGKPVARLETPFERVSQPPIGGQVEVDYVVVQPGNSLWRIARRLFGDGINYVHIYDANQTQIRDPDLIYPGQVFEVPKDLQMAG